jgi:hypothetical protein
MMDILCPKCGEPVDHDELHERAKETMRHYDDVAREFREIGCAALGFKHAVPGQRPIEAEARATAARGVYDALGDDMDGAAALFEDLGIL